MTVEEVDPRLWSGEGNRRVATPRRASFSEGRVLEERDDVTLRQDGDAVDRFELIYETGATKHCPLARRRRSGSPRDR
jgi:hypothetical protein